jgi:hypothetical protein
MPRHLISDAYLLSSKTTAKGTGLAELARKEVAEERLIEQKARDGKKRYYVSGLFLIPTTAFALLATADKYFCPKLKETANRSTLESFFTMM